MLDMLLIITGITLIFYGIYKWLTRNNDYFDKRRLPALKAEFIVGNTGKFFMRKVRVNEFISDLYNQFPNERLFGLFDFSNPFIFLRDPELVKQLAIKDFDNFTDHRSFIDGERIDDLFSNSLFLMKGNRWRNMRSTLSPAFTGSKMRQMFELVCECADEMASYFNEMKKKERLTFDIKDLFRRYTNDVIASCAFGVKINSFENRENEFITTGSRILNFSSITRTIKLLFIRLAPSLMRILGIEFIAKSDSNFFTSLITNAIDMRLKQGIFRPDMINIIMQLRQGKTINHHSDEHNLDAGFATVQESEYNNIKNVSDIPIWTDRELMAQCFLFFVAGFDTTSTALTFCLYELAINPDVQKKLYEEFVHVDRELAGQRIRYDTLQKMQYLDQVISESLRKWPPAMLTDRRCVKNFTLTDANDKPVFTFEKGISMWIPIFAYHHDPKYFPNPEQFNPERFSVENRDNINPNTFIPFGVGPRNCIGSRFALMEIKAVLYSLLLKFEIVPTEKTPIPLKLKKIPIGVIPEKPIILQFKPRNS